jgi:L-fuconolactonase
LRRAFGPDDLRPDLAREGITGTVVIQALPRIDETRYLLSLAEAEPFVAGVVGWVDLGADDVAEQIESLRSAPGGEYLVGVRHPVCAETDPDWLRSDEVQRGLDAVLSAGLAFDLQACARELPAALAVCGDHPGLRFVLDHLAAPPIASGDLSAWGRAILPLAELPNVSAKISGLVTQADWRTWSIDDLRHPVELAVDAFGAGRLMLGSDWPRCLLAGAYSDALDSCRYLLAELPAHEQDAIRGGTASRLYRLTNRAD